MRILKKLLWPITQNFSNIDRDVVIIGFKDKGIRLTNALLYCCVDIMVIIWLID